MFLDIHSHNGNKNSILNVIVGERTESNIQNYSLGIHPWFITDIEAQTSLLETQLKLNPKRLLLIGECGLDKIKGADFNIQKEVFIQQIKLSEKYKKPLIIHCVKAYNELLEIHKKEKPIQSWVIHGFNKNIELAEQLLSRGVYLSFGVSILKSIKQQGVLKKIPISKLFLETDDNTTHSIEELYTFVSDLLNIKQAELQKQIESNLWKLIG